MLTLTLVIQTIGGAFLVSAAQSAFESVLTKKLRELDPSVDPLQVIGTGATDVRITFAPVDMPFILQAYVEGIRTAFVVAIAFACACTIIAFGAKWQKMQTSSNLEETNTIDSTTKTVEAKDAV